MTPDVTLCRPVAPDARCENCKRWLGHQNVIGHVVPVVNTAGSRDPACIYLPISLQREAA